MTRRTHDDDPYDDPYDDLDDEADADPDLPGEPRDGAGDEDERRSARPGARLREFLIRLVAGPLGRPDGRGNAEDAREDEGYGERDGEGRDRRTGGRRRHRERHLVPRFDPEIGFVGEPADLRVPWRYTVPRWLLAALVLLAAVALVVVLVRLDPVGTMIAALPWWLWPWS